MKVSIVEPAVIVREDLVTVMKAMLMLAMFVRICVKGLTVESAVIVQVVYAPVDQDM